MALIQRQKISFVAVTSRPHQHCLKRMLPLLMMGAPAPSETRVWLTLKSVVSGRLVNVYSQHDYLLGFLHRFSNTHFGVAGLQEVQGADGVENYNAGDLPRGHLGYSSAVGRILRDIGWENVDRSPMRGRRHL